MPSVSSDVLVEPSSSSKMKSWMKKEITLSRAVGIGIITVFVIVVVAVGLIVGLTGDNSSSSNDGSSSATTSAPPVVTTLAPTPELDYRIPTAIVPVSYDVRLQPFIGGNFSILGSVAIEMMVMEATSVIAIHMADIITFNDTIRLTQGTLTGTEVNILVHTYVPEFELYVAYLTTNLVVGETYFIYMEFEGFLNDQLRGFYRSVYVDEDGSEVFLATTQFQPTDARRAFPCFDEPAMKATFTISLARTPDMVAVSNMPLASSTPTEDGWIWDQFETSVQMSTYLVAFVISDFVSINTTTANDVLFSIYARTGGIDSAQESLDLGSDVLTFFEDYFAIPYPLPKQDMFAIPDFSAGAMENWGLITYREAYLLYDPQISTVSNKEFIGEVIVHELAHQWFGNLVTPYWWIDLWLNEGFATYLSYVGLDPFQPSWRMLEQFIYREMHIVMSIDALPTSHPISVPVSTPDEINEIFDVISYNKGACIIRMMQMFLTEETFKTGLTNYLIDRSYSAATQDDLWEFLTTQAHADGTLDSTVTVKEIMDTWTLQMGYPVVTVTRGADGTTATIEQARFLLIESSDTPGDDDPAYIWTIPLTYTSQSESDFNNTDPSMWLSGTTGTVTLPADEWFIFNIQESGYYRVNYDLENWERIIAQLTTDHTGIGIMNRAQIMDDLLNLARAGILSYTTALDAAAYLESEREYVPWVSSLYNLGYLESMFSDSADYDNMTTFLLDILEPVYLAIGFEDDVNGDHLEQKLRLSTTSWACSLNYPDCVTDAIAAFEAWVLSGGSATEVSPNLKSTVYCTGIAEGTTENWEFAWNVAQTINLASERDLILSALGCSRDPTILEAYLDMAFTEGSGIRLQDTSRVFSSVAGNDVGRDIAWEYVQQNFEAMAAYSGSFNAAGEYVETVTYEFNTEEQLNELLAFQEQYASVIGTATLLIEQSVERVTANIAWMEANYDTIASWLEEKYAYAHLVIRLPDALIPSHYDVRLNPHIDTDFSVDGYVKVDFEVVEATRLVVLHMADIITNNDTIVLTRVSDGTVVPIIRHSYDNENQYYIAEVEENLVVGDEYSIEMEFLGYLNDQLKGFYRSTYQDTEGNDVYLAMTQFGPTDARRAFPCFDEPHLKATFSITLGRSNSRSSTSNMPLSGTIAFDDGSDFSWDTFETSVAMSTYLVAFVISDFATVTEDVNGEGRVTFGVMARAEAMTETEYALEVGPPVLVFFEDYFTIDYPLPKVDMVAVPDFAAGAMENWGLITYRETAMLYDPLLSSAANKQRVGIVIAHELAHQWFGNLVTPSWWTDIWLNEGFASYHEYLGLASHEVTWALEDQFVTDTLYAVFRADSLLTSHPVSMEVNTTEEITALFDLISYNKGASLLRMMSNFLTEDTFKAGLTNYLNELAYQAATQDDLWRHLENQATTDGIVLPTTISEIMDTWTLQMGYPYITVTHNADNTATVTQRRFLRDGSDGPYYWWVPLSFTYQSLGVSTNTAASDWIPNNEDPVTVTGLPGLDEWVIFNVLETGYYRVNYDEANWLALIQQMETDHTVIHTVNRAQLLDDSLNLARADIISYDIPLSLLSTLSDEIEYVPWLAALDSVSYLESMLSRTSGYDSLTTYLTTVLTPVYEFIGFDDDLSHPHLDQLLRSSIASWMCHLEHESCVTSAMQEFEAWFTSGGLETTVSPNMKYTTYCMGIAQGEEAEWNFAWERYLASTLATEQSLLLQAMGCSRDVAILNSYLEAAFTDGSGIRKQDASTVFSSVSSNDIGRELAWDYLVTNWDHIVAYSDAFTTLSNLISAATAEFNTEAELQELLAFQEANAGNLGTAERSVEQAIESTEANIAWLEANYDEIINWINGVEPTTVPTTDPQTTDPQTTDPQTTDPQTTDPATTDPQTTDPPTTVPTTEPDLDFRIPENIVPVRYEVTLIPFIEVGNFNTAGSVTIELEVVQPTSRIVLHMADIITDNDTISLREDSATGREITFSSHEYDPNLEYYIGSLDEQLVVGQTYFFSTSFTGYLNDQLRGFYRSVYTTSTDEERYIATTQFQPTDARRAFPCFDEPHLKAIFSISIASTVGMTPVSNMPVLSSGGTVEGYEDMAMTVFEDSVRMSTYLVAFVVSDFEFKEDTTENGVLFRVYARHEGIDDAQLALTTGTEVLTFFEGYYNISYPLEKQDMFAIPDFAAGAMENWGLITYRESALLYNTQQSTAANAQRVGIIVAHELAHQWFGNLVTPYWWTDLWLNEGFASYMEYVGLATVYPDWNIMEQFVSTDLHFVFGLDALTSSHPISIPVSNPSEINGIFDSISYSKGASIIRMMEHFLTEATFTVAITDYLNDKSYDVATQDDLWGFLTTQAHADGTLATSQTVKEIMDTWTLQMGYPVITVTRNEGTNEVIYEQKRFLLNPDTVITPDEEYLWWVPINYMISSDMGTVNTQPSLWLSPDAPQMTMYLPSVPPTDAWLIANIQQTGYYRVNYDENNWDLITQQLLTDHEIINEINRAQLIDDSLNLARADLLSYDTALSLQTYLVNGRSYVPWSSAFRNLEYLEKMFSREADYELMKMFLQEVVVPTYESVGFTDTDSDPHLEKLLRSSATSWACLLEYEDCVTNAVADFADWVASSGDETSVSPNLKSTVYCTGIAEGTTAEWDFAWNVAQTTNLATERDMLLSALGCSRDTVILETYLGLAFTENSGIRNQDSSRVFAAIAGNDIGRDIAWEYLQENFIEMAEYSGSFTTAGGYVEDATIEFNTPEQLAELEAFRVRYEASLGAAESAIDQSIERVTANIAWMTANYQEIVDWLYIRYHSNGLTIRLPGSLVPVHYTLRLLPQLEEPFIIDGSAIIEMDVIEATRRVVLHIKDIETLNDTIRLTRDTEDGPELTFLSHHYLPDLEYYVGVLDSNLEVGVRYFLHMDYVGYLSDTLVGFYRSVYVNSDGETITVAATKFQPTDARKAFPCFDEPALKASYKVFLGRMDTMTALSNMPLLDTQVIATMPGWVYDEFEESVPMSTYLVAFMITDFESSTEVINGVNADIDFSVWAREEFINQAAYSLEIGVACLQFFEGYFDVEYPLPKSDMIALPDFDSGAMENWGLIGYRETYMLYDEVTSTAAQKQLVAQVVVHELAHMWFGNLVTPYWWTDLWLNEGFASYMEYVGLAALEPTWNVHEQFVYVDMHSVMVTDSLQSSHPISIEVNHPSEINEIFDSISYNKGAAIIRMMEHSLSESTFTRALTSYIEANSYSVATQDDLWEFLTTQAHADGTLDSTVTVKEIMDTWTLQMGYPVVTVTRSADGTSAETQQSRFLQTNVALTPDEDYKWWIPITCTTQAHLDFITTFPLIWMPNNDFTTTTITGLPDSTQWVVVNVKETGYYRVNYDANNWILLQLQLIDDHTVIDATNRAQIVDDAMNLARSGILEYTTALDLTKYLTLEENFNVWGSSLRSFGYLESMFSWQSCYEPMRSYLMSRMEPVYSSVGFTDGDSDDHLTQRLRELITTWACNLDHGNCVTSATNAFVLWNFSGGDQSVLSPNTKSTTFCTAIRNGGDAEWDFAWSQYLTTEYADVKDMLIYGLGCSTDIDTLSGYLDTTFNNAASDIRKQDSWKVFRAVARNNVGRDLAWNYLRDNWELLGTYYGSYITPLERLLVDVTYEFNTNEQLLELQAFQSDNADTIGTATSTIEQAIERTSNNILWLSTNLDTITAWLVAETGATC